MLGTMGTPLHWYSLCVVALFLKMFALSAYQGFYRISRREFVNPEDSAVFNQPPAKEDLPQVQRAAKAWLNDLENIPIFIGLGIAYVLTEASPGAAIWLFSAFTGARILHTLMYLLGLQPWRTITYAVVILCLLGMSWNIISALLY
ncbi:MAPEG family protein [Nodularia spumigena CS-1038]|uniref:MAPEG family protein n=2 Tax=Cyanobacteriota TaxID=1117 RepID=UPI00232EBBBB|nr:MAPEG family protein [Nodularia spumigena]MDB9340248.1 MAPEG family protein [Nodularia spumigena CS-589/07]MDB9532484.1 MAPEG family protein [Nodularia spumigena CS-1038]